MNRERCVLSLNISLVVVFLMVACSGTSTSTLTPTFTPTPSEPTENLSPTPFSPTPTPSTADATIIAQIVKNAGKIEPDAEKDDVILTTEDTKQDADTKYIIETHDVVENIDNVTYLGLNDDVIWPGNLIKGDRINSFDCASSFL